MAIDVGDRVTLKAKYRLATGGLVDPDTVQLVVSNPDGDQETYDYPADISRVGEGIYQATIDVDVAGTWKYRWVSTGEGQAVEQSSFKVEGLSF